MSNQRGRHPVVATAIAEGEAALVTVPLLVDLGQVAGIATLDLVVTVVGAQLTTGGAVLTGRHRRDEVEGAGTEAVLGAGEGSHRADLDDVAREVGVEVVALVGPDLGNSPALLQVDEGISCDLVGEPGAALAQHAPLAVQQHLGRNVDRLGVGALDSAITGLTTSVGHGLVLQRALAALVTDGAVQRVIDEKELQHPLLGLAGHLGADLGLDDHSLGHGHGTRRLRLGETTTISGVGNLDEALAAGTRRVEQRMVAEPGDGGADGLGCADNESSFGDAHLLTVDGAGDEFDGLVLAHAPAPSRTRRSASVKIELRS